MGSVTNLLCLFFIIITSVLHMSVSVDRNNFKKCEESGFCRRQRKSSPSNFFLIPDSFVTLKTKVSATLKDANSGQELAMTLTKLRGRIFRLHVNEVNPLKPRYEIPVGDSLKREPQEEEIKVGKLESGDYALKGEHSVLASISPRPFRVAFFIRGKPVVTLNARDLLKMEQLRKKEETPSPEPEKKENAEGSEEKKEEEEKKDDGSWSEDFRGHQDSKPNGPSAVALDVRFGPDFSHVYGIPEHADTLSLRDTTNDEPYRLYNLDVFEYELGNSMALYGSVPLMWAHNTKNTVGLFWHNPSETWIDIAKNADIKSVDTHWISESGVIDAFIMIAEQPKEAFYQYAGLTGTTPLPPLFSIAYHQCRWNYNDQEDLLGVDENFDKHDIPMDVLWLDIEHTDGKKYFTWDSTKFPDPVAMVEKLNGKRRKLVTVIDPHIKRDGGWDLYKEASDKTLFVKDRSGNEYEGWCWPGSSSWLDFMNPEIRKWWAQRFLTYTASRPDNTFTWNDMGEPSVFNGPEVTMHKDAIHHGGWEHRDVHNLFGMQIHRASWEGQLLRSENHERPFVLTRAFFAGSQRYGAVWTGDNAADWSHLAASLPMVMSLGLAGITFSGADVGGFFRNPDPELLVRWYQAGAFQPFFRAHAHLDTKRREPWLFAPEHREAIRQAIRQRYTFLPYWYTQFYRSETTGEPVMAPLWVHFPKDENTFAIENSHMIGSALLVHPVTSAGATNATVYLPGTKDQVWYHGLDATQYDGGNHVKVPLDMSSIPFFFAGGSIIPKKERIRRSANLGRYDPYTIVVALDKNMKAHGYLYLDDYHSHRYRDRKEFCFLHLSYADGELRAQKVDLAADYTSKSGVERVVIFGLPEPPKTVTSHNEVRPPTACEFTYDAARKVLTIRKPAIEQVTDEWFVNLKFDRPHPKRDDL